MCFVELPFITSCMPFSLMRSADRHPKGFIWRSPLFPFTLLRDVQRHGLRASMVFTFWFGLLTEELSLSLGLWLSACFPFCFCDEVYRPRLSSTNN